jgi:hypothetical protein
MKNPDTSKVEHDSKRHREARMYGDHQMRYIMQATSNNWRNINSLCAINGSQVRIRD